MDRIDIDNELIADTRITSAVETYLHKYSHMTTKNPELYPFVYEQPAGVEPKPNILFLGSATFACNSSLLLSCAHIDGMPLRVATVHHGWLNVAGRHVMRRRKLANGEERCVAAFVAEPGMLLRFFLRTPGTGGRVLAKYTRYFVYSNGLQEADAEAYRRLVPSRLAVLGVLDASAAAGGDPAVDETSHHTVDEVPRTCTGETLAEIVASGELPVA